MLNIQMYLTKRFRATRKEMHTSHRLVCNLCSMQSLNHKLKDIACISIYLDNKSLLQYVTSFFVNIHNSDIGLFYLGSRLGLTSTS